LKTSQNANSNFTNWLLLIAINVLSFFSLSTFVTLRSAFAMDRSVTNVASPELSTQKNTPNSPTLNIELNQSLIQLKQPQTISQKIVLPTQLADVSTEAKKLFPIQSQSITQQIDLSDQTSDNLEDVKQLRQELFIQPLVPATPPPQRTYQPGLSFGAPSAFGASWGDFFIGASGATPGKSRDGNPDASMSAGLGLGNPYSLVGLEFTFNNGSIKNFGYNGTFDFKAHRVVYVRPNHQVAVAGGWNTFAQYGNEGIRPSGAYGVITSYSFLQPENPNNPMALSFSVGAGGGDFRQDDASTGVFGGVGLQVHRQVGMGIGWSGVGLNAGVSFIPEPTIPFVITAQGADLTDNSFGGRIFVVTVGYGFNFLPR
jgi:hypothetical protein